MTLFQNDNDDTIIKVDDGTDNGVKVVAVGNRAGVDAVVSSITASSQPLPTGASTSALQTTGNASLAAIDAGVPAALGQTTMAASMPVVLSSDHSNIIVDNANRSTYAASIAGLVVPAAATDIFTITGSASKTIKIRKVHIDGTTTAGSGKSVNFSLIKRSSADSGGTSTTMTNVPFDSNNAAATATVRAYTANPTLGTTVGAVVTDRLDIPTVGASGRGADNPIWQFGIEDGQNVVLRGTTQQLCANLGGATITNPVFACFVEWSEE